MVFFIAICVTSFLISKNITKLGGPLGPYMNKLSGFVNAGIIGTTNYLYKKAVTPLVKKENIKYEVDFNNALTQKIFIF
jgi:hypothetical protein